MIGMMRLAIALSLALSFMACSDDTKPSTDLRATDAARDLAPRSDLPAKTDGKPASDGKPADAKPPEAGGGTPCGSGFCSGLQVCVGKTPVGPTTTYSCESVIKGCEGASLRNCACLGQALCTGSFNVCTDSKLPNTILCECPNCQ